MSELDARDRNFERGLAGLTMEHVAAALMSAQKHSLIDDNEATRLTRLALQNPVAAFQYLDVVFATDGYCMTRVQTMVDGSMPSPVVLCPHVVQTIAGIEAICPGADLLRVIEYTIEHLWRVLPAPDFLRHVLVFAKSHQLLPPKEITHLLAQLECGDGAVLTTDLALLHQSMVNVDLHGRAAADILSTVMQSAQQHFPAITFDNQFRVRATPVQAFVLENVLQVFDLLRYVRSMTRVQLNELSSLSSLFSGV